MATTGARTPQFSQKQSGGAFAYADIRRHPAAVFFVDSTNSLASDSEGFGENPDMPFATIDYAVSQCTDSVGDVIYAMPGHIEVLTAGGDLDLDVIGISVRGLGEGALQPVISFTTIISVDMDVDAASITCENLNFQAAFADITAMIDVNATDFTLRNCRFTQSAVDMNALICVQDAAGAGSDRITIENCEAIMYDASNTHFVNFSGTGEEHIVRNNVLLGDWGTIAVGGAGVLVLWTVTDNYIHNVAVTDDAGIVTAGTTTGLIYNNRLGYGDVGNATTTVDADLCAMCENYSVDSVSAAQGILDPA